MLKRNYKDTNNALVLTGGGARAAYQVGVLSAITKFVPRNHGIPFPILCGTSAGSINSTALACYASCFHLGVKKLEWIWKNLQTDNIYHNNALGIFGHIGKGMRASIQTHSEGPVSRSLLNNAPLQELLNSLIDFNRIKTNIEKGYLTAASITASSYNSGDSISFYQSNNQIKPWQRFKRYGNETELNCQHLMASSAIPLVFPAIKIANEYFGDGSIHQLSPLSPAIHLGAKNILVIGVEQPQQQITADDPDTLPPTTASIAGHLLDSAFSDTLHSDLERMNRINNTLSLIPKKKQLAVDGLQHITSLVINPSENINAIAAKHYEDLPLSIRILLRSFGVNNDSDSSIISYLLFEQNYCNELIKLGFKDAMVKEQEIRLFLQHKREPIVDNSHFSMFFQQLINRLKR